MICKLAQNTLNLYYFPRARGVLPIINELMGMCRSMESHFHDWIVDDNEVASSTEFPTELLEWSRKLSEFGGRGGGGKKILASGT